jgi:hypothetical protein
LDPRVTPCRILLRHADDKSPDLEQHPAPSGLSAARPFPGDQLAMPPQQGVRRRDRGDLPQGRTADSVRTRRQPAAIIIGQAHAPDAQLAAEAPVFFDQVGDDLPFSAGQPVGHDRQQQLKGRSIDHGPELTSRPRREDLC